MALVLWEMASRCEVVGGRSIAPGFPGTFLLPSSPYRDAAHPHGGTGPDLGWLGSPLGCREQAADPPPWLPALCAAARGGRLRGRGAGRDPRAHLVQPPLQAGRPPSLLRAGAGDGKQTRQEEPKLPPPPRPQALWVVFFQTTATGTRRLQPLTEPRPPSPPRATSRHLKWRKAKHLISCPAVSPCLPPSLPPSLPLSALSSSFPVPPTCNTDPQSCKKLQPSARKLPRPPRVPHARWRGSDAPCILCSRASVPGHPSPLVFHLHLCPGRSWQKPGLSPLQQGVSPWPPTTWGCSSGRAISSLTRSLPTAGIWMLVPWSPLSRLSPAQHILPTQNTSCPKTDQVLCSASLGFRKGVRWFLGPFSENNLHMKTQHYISVFKF